MAWERWKDCWYPGTFTAFDPVNQVYRTVTYSAADVARGVENARGLLAKQYPIPLCWVHDAANVPRAAAQLAADIAKRTRETFGLIKDVRLHPDGYAECLLAGDDDDDLRRLPKVRFVSPQINEGWTDPDERPWIGPVIAHVAATPRPIQYRQRPFQMSADGAARPAVVQLSFAGYEGETPMADDPKKAGGAGEDGPCPPALIEALKAAGLTVPDEVATIADLIIAIKAGMDVSAEEDQAAGVAAAGAGTEAPPVMMSADAQAQIAALEARLARQEGEILRRDRDRMQARLAAAYASGRASPQQRDAWTRQLQGAVQLSADGTGTGQIPVQLAAEVAAHEQLPPGSIWSGERRTAAPGGSAADLPDDMAGEEEQLDKDTDAYAARRNRGGKPAARE